MLKQLDDTDITILRELQKSGRVTNTHLAKLVGLSAPSVLQRVRSLEKAGLIRNYVALLDPNKLGFTITAWAMISLSLHQEKAIELFRKEITKVDEVVECYHVSGDFDFLAKIVVTDIRAYEKLIRERISSIKGIAKINTSFVYGIPKSSTRLPL